MLRQATSSWRGTSAGPQGGDGDGSAKGGTNGDDPEPPGPGVERIVVT
jgi:hypothetical protein